MPGRRGFALLCCTLALLQGLQLLPGAHAKRRPAHSHHHSAEAAAGREQKAFELPGGGIPGGGGGGGGAVGGGAPGGGRAALQPDAGPAGR